MVSTPSKRKSTVDAGPAQGGSSKKRRITSKTRSRSMSLDSFDDTHSWTAPLKPAERSLSPYYDTPNSPQPALSPRRPTNRQRSFSLDSVPESIMSSSRSLSVTSERSSLVASARPRSPQLARARSATTEMIMNVVMSSAVSSTPAAAAVYRPFRNEVAETKALQVPGESRGERGLPVRMLSGFTIYDHGGDYVPFAFVVRSILAGKKRDIRASGCVSRRLHNPDDGDSDIADGEIELLVSLQRLVDFWVDYNDDSEESVWVKTKFSWYILSEPAPLYATFYQPFWMAHRLTWLVAKETRRNLAIRFEEFCQHIEDEHDEEANTIMGRGLGVADLDSDYIIMYIVDQLSCHSLKDSQNILATPLLTHLVTRATAVTLELEKGTFGAEFSDEFVASERSDESFDPDNFVGTFDSERSDESFDPDNLVGTFDSEESGNSSDLDSSDETFDPGESDDAFQSETSQKTPRSQKSARNDVAHDPTVTMPLVHELTTGLFLKTLLKAGKKLDSQDRDHRLLQDPKRPNILHPDQPTNIEWEDPVPGATGYFRKLWLDGEPYTVGEVVMVKPGEDDIVHRAQSAVEACSQSQNEFVNNVWFCRIIYMCNGHTSLKSNTSAQIAHVQWYEHGSKTILQETASPYGLFALAECTDIPVGSILGRCLVQHTKPEDKEPCSDYYCSFLWDANEARFLDQAILAQKVDAHEGSPHCPCCAFNAPSETFIYSDGHAKVQGIDYHKNDFVWIAAKPNHPYLIGQIRRFIIGKSLTHEETQVELTRLGRFDDIACIVGGSHVTKDEARLFMTEQIECYSLPLLEGKCFVHSKDTVKDSGSFDHQSFYVDQFTETLNVQHPAKLLPYQGSSLVACATCINGARQEKEVMQEYMASNTPLKAMELFSGAGGLSTGLEQSGFVKTHWAVELSSEAAATFQANHPLATVYNQDTNLCLQNAIDTREGKPCLPLHSLSSNKKLPPMPQHGEVDLIAGGFPCQSFSGINHQRHKHPDDIRTTLVANMLSFVEFYEPQYVLMENVKGLLQHHVRGDSSAAEDEEDEDEDDKIIKMGIVKFVLRTLTCLGYQAQLKVLQAADYGSPQRRERVIFWGARRSQILPDYPFPTHVDPKYKTHTLSLPTYDKLSPAQRSDWGCAPFRALIIADAISDLPGFDWKNPHAQYSENEAEKEETRQRRKRYEQRSAVATSSRKLAGFLGPVDYATAPRTSYQRMMRGNKTQVTLHCSRAFTAPVVERLWHVCGQNVHGPYDLPRALWTPIMIKASQEKSSKKLLEIWHKRFGRLRWKEPFNTALTSCHPFSKAGKVVHPRQKRILTARECARSQGFPDYYEFVQNDNDASPDAWAKLLSNIYKQIGNAVPVPLARALGGSLGKALIRKWLQVEGCNAVFVNQETESEVASGRD